MEISSKSIIENYSIKETIDYKKHVLESKKRRKYELFGGKLGAVNATKKDAEKVTKDLNSFFKNHASFSNESMTNSFKIKGYLVDGNDHYLIQIYEDRHNKDLKICIDIRKGKLHAYSDDKIVSSKNGLTLDSKRICKELDSALRRAGVDVENSQSLDDIDNKRNNKNNFDRKITNLDLDYEDSLNKQKTRKTKDYYSRQDWYDINNKKSDLIDYARI